MYEVSHIPRLDTYQDLTEHFNIWKVVCIVWKGGGGRIPLRVCDQKKSICITSYIHTCIHTYIHTYIIHTYIHTYIHTHIHTLCTCTHTPCTPKDWEADADGEKRMDDG